MTDDERAELDMLRNEVARLRAGLRHIRRMWGVTTIWEWVDRLLGEEGVSHG